MPLKEDELFPTLFAAGSSSTFVAADTGELICFANDHESLYWNNRGAVDVTVTRTSWPPVNATGIYEC